MPTPMDSSSDGRNLLPEEIAMTFMAGRHLYCKGFHNRAAEYTTKKNKQMFKTMS